MFYLAARLSPVRYGRVQYGMVTVRYGTVTVYGNGTVTVRYGTVTIR